MSKVTCSASPIVFLYRIGALEWLPKMFDEIWMPSCVLDDLLQARFIGYDVPSPFDLPWVQYEDPAVDHSGSVAGAGLELRRSRGHVAGLRKSGLHRPSRRTDGPPRGRVDRLAVLGDIKGPSGSQAARLHWRQSHLTWTVSGRAASGW